jgi:hypothetical protein
MRCRNEGRRRRSPAGQAAVGRGAGRRGSARASCATTATAARSSRSPQAARVRRGSRALRGGPLALPRRRAGALPHPALSARRAVRARRRLRRPHRRKGPWPRWAMPAVPTRIPARPGWSATTTRSCAARSATGSSRPTSTAAPCVRWIPCRRQPGTDLRLSDRHRPAAGDGGGVRRAGGLGGGSRSAHRRDPGDGQPAFATTPTCSSTASPCRLPALNDNPSRPQFNRAGAGRRGPRLHAQAADRASRAGQRRAQAGGHGPCRPACSTCPAAPRLGRFASRGGHGWTDLRKSIYESVNTYYYRLALDMGIAKFDEYMDALRLRQADRHRPVRRDRRHPAVAGMESCQRLPAGQAGTPATP